MKKILYFLSLLLFTIVFILGYWIMFRMKNGEEILYWGAIIVLVQFIMSYVSKLRNDRITPILGVFSVFLFLVLFFWGEVIPHIITKIGWITTGVIAAIFYGVFIFNTFIEICVILKIFKGVIKGARRE